MNIYAYLCMFIHIYNKFFTGVLKTLLRNFFIMYKICHIMPSLSKVTE